MKRVIFDVTLFLSVFILPWWFCMFLALVGLFIFDEFYEFVVTCSIIYSLFGLSDVRLFFSPLFFPIVVFSIFVIIQIIRNHLILFDNEISY